MIHQAQCIFVTGRRGSGKTTRVLELAGQALRVIAYDPTGEYARGFGWPSAATLEELRRLLAPAWRRSFRIAYTPAPPHLERGHFFAEVIFRAQEPFERGRLPLLRVILEEMQNVYPVQDLPRDRQGMVTLTNQGRHRGIEIIGVSQRPASVSKNFRDNCAAIYALAPGIGAADFMGPRYRAEIERLEPHAWLKFEGAGIAARGKNRPLASNSVAPRRRGA